VNKFKKTLASLSLVAAATAGIVIPQVAGPSQSAEAKTTCKTVIRGYNPPSITGPLCWFQPGYYGCSRTPIYGMHCGGKF